ncbi:hypothetical protein [Alkalicoccus saliphilus]|uniref:Uncharacterized protein n=1 Tax=Alkalicoccus saliphilus TaxID=200989 RepID=A0A2T4U2M2_9BACI|nr:hypothetical protein [Alkalicoccus saliphilus]PTL37650.1 hypothetical protein C6Y45_15420 [Alkalicoccus saliphilus]
MKDLKDLTHELDFNLGELSHKKEVLSDIEEKLSLLKQKMEKVDGEANSLEELGVYHREYAIEVRILSELMYHTMRGLENNCEVAHQQHTKIFELVHFEHKKRS